MASWFRDKAEVIEEARKAREEAERLRAQLADLQRRHDELAETQQRTGRELNDSEAKRAEQSRHIGRLETFYRNHPTDGERPSPIVDLNQTNWFNGLYSCRMMYNVVTGEWYSHRRGKLYLFSRHHVMALTDESKEMIHRRLAEIAAYDRRKLIEEMKETS